MIIRKKDKTSNFTTLYNACLKDEKISWQAKGLFAYLMTLPEDWQIYKTELVTHSSNGRDATFKAFNELIEKGYILVEEIKGEKGKFGKKVYRVFEEAQVTEKPSLKNRYWNSVTGKPSTENQKLLNTNKLNTNTNSDNFPEPDDFPEYEEINEFANANSDVEQNKNSNSTNNCSLSSETKQEQQDNKLTLSKSNDNSESKQKRRRFAYYEYTDLHSQIYEQMKVLHKITDKPLEYNFMIIAKNIKHLLSNPFFTKEKILQGIRNAVNDDAILSHGFSLQEITSEKNMTRLIEERYIHNSYQTQNKKKGSTASSEYGKQNWDIVF